jgi:glycosyltransferase involved in cell wall biosynthesis
VRILLWHGWLLEGSGSNVYSAKVAEVLRRDGHQVLIVCQERHPERFSFVDAWATVGPNGLTNPVPTGVATNDGFVTLLRPEIGSMLPVFVIDEYEGFDSVKRFVDLTDDELGSYLQRNVDALRAASDWFEPDAVITGHAVPGAVVALRALGPERYAVKIHGSDLEYAVRLDDRYRELARQGLEGAIAVLGATRDVLARTLTFVPSIAGRTRIAPPGADAEHWRPLPRQRALELAAVLLDSNEETVRGRPAATGRSVAFALAAKDGEALDALALGYDQAIPDPDAAERLRALASYQGPLVGYLGKFIPQKGVDLLIQALAILEQPARLVLVGFGQYREWLEGLTLALHLGQPESVRWLGSASSLSIELGDVEIADAAGLADRVIFTGRLDHRYAPAAIAALDVLVVPSVMDEAFGMVAAEAAATGALPLVARHSGLAEIATALENAVGQPELFSYQSGPGAVRAIAAGLERLLAIPEPRRSELRSAVSDFVGREWSWARTAAGIVAAARIQEPEGPPDNHE